MVSYTFIFHEGIFRCDYRQNVHCESSGDVHIESVVCKSSGIFCFQFLLDLYFSCTAGESMTVSDVTSV